MLSGNKTEDALVQLADAEAERDAILSALMALSLTSRQILHYSFCVQDHYSNYKIAREVGYSERSIQRMKSEALIEFAEAYRNGKIIEGRITGIQPYGAFVSLDNRTQGLIHISECHHGYVDNIRNFLKVGKW